MEASEDGKSLVVFTPEKRLRVNLRDTYFASALQVCARYLERYQARYLGINIERGTLG